MAFDNAAWEDRLAAALNALEKVQEPYLQAYWERYPRKLVFVNGRDETPFPLDDLRMVYAEARHSQKVRHGVRARASSRGARSHPLCLAIASGT